MTNDFDYTQAFAKELKALKSTDLTQRDLSQLERLVLDYCGVAIGGGARPWISALHRWAERYRGTGPAKIIGSDISVSAEIAAFVNGAAGHSFELDDTHDASMSHPGAVVIPTALAVASETGAGGGEVLAAIAAGYEVMARLGIAARAERMIGAGYHPTAILGVFGAAAAAAKLFHFTPEQLACAWGHGLSLAAGSMQFSQESTGAEVKRVHAGYAARNGVLSAQMAALGVAAPNRSLDGKYGFLALYGDDPMPEELLKKGQRGLAVHDISVKPYACCRLLHSMIDGLRAATDGFSVPSRQIRRIVVRGPRKLMEQHMISRPCTPMAAQYSLPFTIGATMTLGPSRFDAFELHNLSDPDILAWADRILVEHDEELEAAYPAHFGTEVEVEFSDGRRQLERVLDSIGTPVNPMPYEALTAKARALVGAQLSDAGFDAMVGAVKRLSEAGSVVALQTACTR